MRRNRMCGEAKKTQREKERGVALTQNSDKKKKKKKKRKWNGVSSLGSSSLSRGDGGGISFIPFYCVAIIE